MDDQPKVGENETVPGVIQGELVGTDLTERGGRLGVGVLGGELNELADSRLEAAQRPTGAARTNSPQLSGRLCASLAIASRAILI